MDHEGSIYRALKIQARKLVDNNQDVVIKFAMRAVLEEMAYGTEPDFDSLTEQASKEIALRALNAECMASA